MADIQDLSITDDSNTGRWPENMAFGQVNNAGRADEGILARWYADTNGTLASSGSSNAFAVTTNRTIGSLIDGLRIAFKANHSINGASTLNLNGLGAKDIKRANGFATVTGDIVSGQPVEVIYSLAADDWYMTHAAAAVDWGAAAINTLTDAATISIDIGTFFNHQVTLGGNRTLGAPSNTVVGKVGTIDVYATGSTRTLSLNSAWKANAGLSFPISVPTTDLATIYYRVLSSSFIQITGLWTGTKPA